MPRRPESSQQSRSERGRDDGQSFAMHGQPRTSASLPTDTETPRRFLHGDIGDPAAAASSDLFPGQDDRQRTVLEGAASTSQGSVFQWHRAGPMSRHQLDADFAAAAQQSEVGQDSDMGGEDPTSILSGRDVPSAKNLSTGTAQQRLFLVLKVVLHAVVVISEVLRLNTKNRCSRCCRHISTVWCSKRDCPEY